MVVAVPTVLMVQVGADQVVRVIAVRHDLMATGRTVLVLRVVRIAGVPGRAAIGVRAIDSNRAFQGL
jgi:hypothetical protein